MAAEVLTPITRALNEGALMRRSDLPALRHPLLWWSPLPMPAAHARCTHGAANLCDGYVGGHGKECPLHQGLFDSRTGAVLTAPARIPLRMAECPVEGGMAQVLM